MIEEQMTDSVRRLEIIKKIVAEYNALYPDSRVEITPERKDIRNIFICTYFVDDSIPRLGMFREMKYSIRPQLGEFRDGGSVYVGTDSSYVAIIESERGRLQNGRTVSLNGKNYVANCRLDKMISFDQMRTYMCTQGVISTYEPGRATNEEILKVILYATELFGIYSNEPIKFSQKLKTRF